MTRPRRNEARALRLPPSTTEARARSTEGGLCGSRGGRDPRGQSRVGPDPTSSQDSRGAGPGLAPDEGREATETVGAAGGPSRDPGHGGGESGRRRRLQERGRRRAPAHRRASAHRTGGARADSASLDGPHPGGGERALHPSLDHPLRGARRRPRRALGRGRRPLEAAHPRDRGARPRPRRGAAHGNHDAGHGHGGSLPGGDDEGARALGGAGAGRGGARPGLARRAQRPARAARVGLPG